MVSCLGFGPSVRTEPPRCARCIALLRPGDLFLCSGGVAHATLSDAWTKPGRQGVNTPRQVEGKREAVEMEERTCGRQREVNPAPEVK